jgi:hypothetical protein
MTFLVLVALYFLPSILGHHKRDAAGIFLLNFFLGWTVIGWIAAMVWALAAEPRRPVLVVAGPGRFCCACGTLNVIGARFCGACGRPV